MAARAGLCGRRRLARPVAVLATVLAALPGVATANPANPASAGPMSTSTSAGVAATAMPRPAGVQPGDAARGARIVASRQQSLCVLCHALPAALGVPAHTQGNLAPPLDGTGARLGEDQIRLRLVDSRRVNPGTIMPPYGVADDSPLVGAAWRGRPVLDAQQIEDVVAYLATLR